jgi:hypothetical protein
MSRPVKRSKQSGAQFKKTKLLRQQAAEKDATAMSRWLSRTDAGPSGALNTEGSSAEDTSDADECKADITAANDEPDHHLPLQQIGVTNEMDINIFSDIGSLTFPVSDGIRAELVRHAPYQMQHKDGPFDVVNGRSLNSSWFTCFLQNKKNNP